MNNIELNQTTCAPILGGFCWKSELCATTNAVCIDNECKCKDNYFRRSNNQCIFSECSLAKIIPTNRLMTIIPDNE